MRKVPMLQLFRAGLFAAGYQLIAAASIGLAVTLLDGHWIIAQPESSTVFDGPDSLWNPGGSFASWAYLLAAFGVIFTSHRHTEITARRIRYASRLLDPTDADQATRALLTQFCLSCMGFVILLLKPPLDLPTEDSLCVGCASLVSIGWPGMMSIGLASFGANARAAHRALKPR
jgi:hypothetical protein